MPQRPPDVMPEIEQGDLSEAQLETYLASPDLAVDTETMGLQPLRDRLCVVQLCDRSGRAVLVQIGKAQLDGSLPLSQRAPRLKRVLEDARVGKVFHFARFDVGTLWHYLGIRVEPVYCTRTASKLVRTYTDRHGLKDCLLELLDIELDKATRTSDWASTALSPDQVRYAISDVTMLLQLKDKLQAMLEREGRSELAQDCFRAIPTMARLDLLGYNLLFEH